MGTEILRPQDCLIDRIRVPPATMSFSRHRKSNYYGSPNPNYYVSNPRPRKPAVRAERPVAVSKRSSSDDDLRRRGFKTEKVTILRRGESLDSKAKIDALAVKKGGGLVVTGTERLGPDSEMMRRQVRVVDLRTPVTGKSDMYAGSAFAVSPEPSSLPLPSFSMKQVAVIVDDSATRDLRRLLRLD